MNVSRLKIKSRIFQNDATGAPLPKALEELRTFFGSCLHAFLLLCTPTLNSSYFVVALDFAFSLHLLRAFVQVAVEFVFNHHPSRWFVQVLPAL